MADAHRFVCSHCKRQVTAWTDGNPYYRDEHGKKRYAYHPDTVNRDRCIGNDVPHLCLACGSETTVDSERPRSRCRRCHARPLIPTVDLEGHVCPNCRTGRFVVDSDFEAIS